MLLRITGLAVLVSLLMCGVARAQSAAPACTPADRCTAELQPGQSVAIAAFRVTFQVPDSNNVSVVTLTFDGQVLLLLARPRFAVVPLNTPRDAGCLTVNGNQLRCSTPRGTIVVSTESQYEPVSTDYCPQAIVSSGWWILSRTPAIQLAAVGQTLYTYRAGDVGYTVVSPDTPLAPADGYWAYIARATTVQFGCTRVANPPPVAPFTLTVGAGWTLIGNGFGVLVPVKVTGVDTVVTYNFVSGYRVTDVLNAGQGAFAYSATGGAVTLTPIVPRPQ